MAYKPTAKAEEPARGPKGSIGTNRFASSETAPASAWNSTVPQKSAGPGVGFGENAERGGPNSPYPDAHSTVPTPDAGSGEYPWPAEKPWPATKGGGMPFDQGSEVLERVPDHGGGDVYREGPAERSTVAPQNAETDDGGLQYHSEAARGGPRREYPADTHKDAYDRQVNDGGSDGGDYRWGVPYSQKMPENSKWGMYGPENGGYGHSEDVPIINLHDGNMNWEVPGFSANMTDPDSQMGDASIQQGDSVASMRDDDWGKPIGAEAKGYEVLDQDRDGPPPSIPDSEQYQTDADTTYGDEYPQPDDIRWDAYPQNLVLKK